MICAVKIMAKGKSARDKQIRLTMYDAEVGILQQLQHKNIINFVEAANQTDEYLIVTEMAAGGELFEKIIDDDFEFTESNLSRIVTQMFDALHYLHEKNIVHRDLKPENWIFKSADPSDLTIILIDFGTAKVVEDDKVYEDLVGTPYYLAPESAQAGQVRTGQILKCSDV